MWLCHSRLGSTAIFHPSEVIVLRQYWYFSEYWRVDIDQWGNWSTSVARILWCFGHWPRRNSVVSLSLELSWVQLPLIHKAHIPEPKAPQMYKGIGYPLWTSWYLLNQKHHSLTCTCNVEHSLTPTLQMFSLFPIYSFIVFRRWWGIYCHERLYFLCLYHKTLSPPVTKCSTYLLIDKRPTFPSFSFLQAKHIKHFKTDGYSASTLLFFISFLIHNRWPFTPTLTPMRHTLCAGREGIQGGSSLRMHQRTNMEQKTLLFSFTIVCLSLGYREMDVSSSFLSVYHIPTSWNIPTVVSGILSIPF